MTSTSRPADSARQDPPSASSSHASGPSLDTACEPWEAWFPALGSVYVSADGSIEVEAEVDGSASVEDVRQREEALRQGWGRPLSFSRQGYALARGAGLVPPGGGACVIVSGLLHDVSLLVVELAQLGWSVLGDRFVPTRWQGDQLVAFSSQSPVLVSRRVAHDASLECTPVRDSSDAVAVDVERVQGPVAAGAFIEVTFRRSAEPVIEDLVGHERFTAASTVMLGGVVAHRDAGRDDQRNILRHDLALARLPFARLRSSPNTARADAAALAAWWGTKRALADQPS